MGTTVRNSRRLLFIQLLPLLASTTFAQVPAVTDSLQIRGRTMIPVANLQEVQSLQGVRVRFVDLAFRNGTVFEVAKDSVATIKRAVNPTIDASMPLAATSNPPIPSNLTSPLAAPTVPTSVRIEPPTDRNGPQKPKARSGLTSIMIEGGIDHVSLGVRDWGKSHGWGLNGQAFFGDSYSGYGAKLFTLIPLNLTQGGTMWYLTAGASIFSMSMDYDMASLGSITMDATTNIVYGALGAEWRFGLKGNWGFALEAGYQKGFGTFEGEMTATSPAYDYGYVHIPAQTTKTSVSQDFDPGPLYIGGNGAYYF
jgi:hypothetical protein